MGFGALLNRNLVYDVTNTVSGETATYTIVTDGGPGAFTDWSTGEYRGLASIPAAWRAMTLISSLLGRVPWVPYREVAGQRPVRLVEPVPLLSRPTAGFEPRLNTYRSWGLDRLAHGNALGLVASRSPLGWPTAVTPVSAECAGVRRVTAEQRLAGFAIGEIAYWINGRYYHASEVIHFKGPCRPGELRGMGVVEQHFRAIERARKLDDQAGSVSAAGVPTGVLKVLNPDLTPAGAQELKDAWLTSQATRTVAVLGQGVEFEPVAWNPSEIQLLEMRQYSITEWANIFGIDSSYLGGQNPSRVYANATDKAVDLLRFGSTGDLVEEFEAVLTENMPRGQYVKGNLDFLLRAATADRYQAHAVAIAAGFLTPDEVREYEERPPLTAEQKADLLALKGPANGPSTAPAGQGSAQRPGSGAQLAQGAPRLQAVRGHLERIGELEDGRDPIIWSVDEGDVLRDDELLDGWTADDHDRAADLTGAKLKEYWTAGEGLAKWAGSRTPWRTLRRLLSKYLSGKKLDATTSSWYRIVFGALPGQR